MPENKISNRFLDYFADLEDQCRVRKDHGVENFAVISHIALNLIKLKESKGSLRGKRKRAGWNHRYLTSVLLSAGF